MEIPSAKCLSGLETLEDPFCNYYPYEISILDYPIDDLDLESFSCEDNDPITFNSQNMIQTSQTTIQKKTNTPSSHIISFDKSSKPSPAYGLNSTINPNNQMESNTSFGSTQDHVVAERKRRERLSQRFVALSTIVPGLKKTDRASVLGEAINYLKHMQDRVKTLEEQTAKRTMESVVFVKKSQVYADDELSSSDENFDGCCEQTLPEIEARVSDKNLLIRIHCEKQKDCLQKILSQLEKIPVNVINTSVLPFGNSTLDVTIVAQVEGELLMKVKDVVKNLRQGLLN
ncbi:transcription factor NAI1-like [Euphorbia lathyris]|uniref:transcription factor NAI1-like n=1 Tax=Euphorbia lathyris TaxID=212925 RepID=UPI00331440CE